MRFGSAEAVMKRSDGKPLPRGAARRRTREGQSRTRPRPHIALMGNPSTCNKDASRGSPRPALGFGGGGYGDRTRIPNMHTPDAMRPSPVYLATTPDLASGRFLSS